VEFGAENFFLTLGHLLQGLHPQLFSSDASAAALSAAQGPALFVTVHFAQCSRLRCLKKPVLLFPSTLYFLPLVLHCYFRGLGNFG
jgi:hypothetical protein